MLIQRHLVRLFVRVPVDASSAVIGSSIRRRLHLHHRLLKSLYALYP
jgi:hypothetical protein